MKYIYISALLLFTSTYALEKSKLTIDDIVKVGEVYYWKLAYKPIPKQKEISISLIFHYRQTKDDTWNKQTLEWLNFKDDKWSGDILIAGTKEKLIASYMGTKSSIKLPDNWDMNYWFNSPGKVINGMNVLASRTFGVENRKTNKIAFHNLQLLEIKIVKE